MDKQNTIIPQLLSSELDKDERGSAGENSQVSLQNNNQNDNSEDKRKTLDREGIISQKNLKSDTNKPMTADRHYGTSQVDGNIQPVFSNRSSKSMLRASKNYKASPGNGVNPDDIPE